MRSFIVILPIFMSCEMTQVALVKHGTGVGHRRPIDGYMMYTDIDFEYHSHLSTAGSSPNQCPWV